MSLSGRSPISAGIIRCGMFFFEEVETDSPVDYVRRLVQGSRVELSADVRPDGTVTVYAVADGLTQKFIFTPL